MKKTIYKFTLKPISLLILTFILFGCAGSNVAISDKFWQTPHLKVAIAINEASVTKANFYTNANQGLLYDLMDYALSRLMYKKLIKFLDDFDVSNLKEIKNDFETEFTKKGVSALIIQKPIDEDSLPVLNEDQDIYANSDFRSIANLIKSDKLLILNVDGVGLVKYLDPGSLAATCHLKGQLIDLNNDKLLWRFDSKTEIPLPKNWNNPPNYPEVSSVLKHVILLSKENLINNLFRPDFKNKGNQ
jgi:hypothetical protein